MTITKNQIMIAAALVAAWYLLKGKGCTCGESATTKPLAV